MGNLTRVLEVASKRELERLAGEIEGEMKGIVSGHSRTGVALGSIGIEMGETSAFVGGKNLHLYYLDEGNGTKTIYPKRAKALRYSDGTFHGKSRPYKGIHFVKEIAARHGG